MVKVLFVCLGNICRSPTAHGVFRSFVHREGLSGHIETDSAGTGVWHLGSPPDKRSAATAQKRGYDLSGLRARKATTQDFLGFDYILAMDNSNYQDLLMICPPGKEHKLHMFLSFATDVAGLEVPDPYYGGAEGFEKVFDMVEDASAGLLAHIRRTDLA